MATPPDNLIGHVDFEDEDDDDGVARQIVPTWALSLTASFALIISIIGFLGNMLTILALPHTRKLRNAATWFVVNLAVIEMVFCVTVLPMSAAHLLHLRTTGEKLFDTNGCRLFVFVRYVVIQAEVLSIAAIALNRCILIAIPKKYPEIFSTVNTFLFIIGIWLVSILVMILPLIEVYGAFSYNANTQECDFDQSAIQARKIYLAGGFLIPCLIIIISYSYIFYKSRESSKRMEARSKSAISIESSTRPVAGLRNRELRIARTIVVIFLVFLLCCTPVSVAHYYGSGGQIPLLLLLLHPLYWVQYCLNIFIYVIMNKQYKEAYINYISVWWPGFSALTQRFQPSHDDDTSTSQPPPSWPMVNALRKISFSLKGSSSEPPSPNTRFAPTPTAKKKFQCWDPPRSNTGQMSASSSQEGIMKSSNHEWRKGSSYKGVNCPKPSSSKNRVTENS